jgi:hypothetical protein
MIVTYQIKDGTTMVVKSVYKIWLEYNNQTKISRLCEITYAHGITNQNNNQTNTNSKLLMH